jgi:hypothetical protein
MARGSAIHFRLRVVSLLSRAVSRSDCVALTALEVVAALVPGAALARLALPRAVLCGAFSARAAGP